jgi:hypothetical protein
MGLKRQYWSGLLKAMMTVCRYYGRYRTFLPTDIPPAVHTACAAICAATEVLYQYDLEHQGGTR